jgi:hypothetical protein
VPPSTISQAAKTKIRLEYTDRNKEADEEARYLSLFGSRYSATCGCE